MLKVKLCVQTQVEKEDIGNEEISFLTESFFPLSRSSKDLQERFCRLQVRF